MFFVFNEDPLQIKKIYHLQKFVQTFIAKNICLHYFLDVIRWGENKMVI